MAKCPNCGRKLRIADWRPECPGCGVNLNYFNSNQRLLEEAEKAEIEHSHFQPRIDRAKAAFAGSKLTIVRIVLSLLPIGGLFLPLFRNSEGSHNVLDVYKFVSGSEDVGGFLGSALSGNLTAVSLVCLLLSAVLILVNLIALIASLGKHGKGRTMILNGIMVLSAIASAILYPFSGDGRGLAVGAFVYIALLAVILGWNIMLIAKGIPVVNYKTCLIGGLPSETYKEYVDSGMSRSELNRKMLVALANLEQEALDKGEIEDEEEDA